MGKDKPLSISKLYELIDSKSWSAVLRGLEVGREYSFRFPSPQAIHSFKSVAYKLNSFRTGRTYSINSNNEARVATVIVKEK